MIEFDLIVLVELGVIQRVQANVSHEVEFEEGSTVKSKFNSKHKL